MGLMVKTRRIRMPRPSDTRITPWADKPPRISIGMMMKNPYSMYRVRKERGKTRFAIFRKKGYSKNKFEMKDWER